MDKELLPYQYEFIEDTEHFFLALIAGFGSGKTYTLCRKAIYMAYLNQGYTGLLYEPTIPLLHDILIPDFEAALEDLQIPYTLRKTPNYNYVLHFPEGDSLVMLRAMENWQRHIGVNAAWIGADEVDTIKKPVAEKAVTKLIGRIRSGNVRQFFFTTTPEGFEFMYEFFVKKKSEKKRIIKARTTDNPFLPEDFVQTLYENYPPELVEAYVNGEFVNLTSGTVFRQFDRRENATDRTIQKGNILHIGMDFNIEKMSAVVCVTERDKAYAVDEIVDLYDTFEMADELYRRYKDCTVYIYPDAAGNQRHSSSTLTDFQILRQKGFIIRVNPANPSVRERIMRINSMFRNTYGERRLFINTEKCPNLTEAIEKLTYKNGAPDKDSGYDHICDALGYFISKFAPLTRPKIKPERVPSKYDEYIKPTTDGLVI